MWPHPDGADPGEPCRKGECVESMPGLPTLTPAAHSGQRVPPAAESRLPSPHPTQSHAFSLGEERLSEHMWGQKCPLCTRAADKG